MSHSKSPWKLKYNKGADWVIYAKDGYSIMAISYDPQWGRPKEDEANSKLISAAPDLLKALEFCHDELGQYDMANDPDGSSERARINAINMAVKAINKARGLK